MRRLFISLLLAGACAAPVAAEGIDPAKVEAVFKASFSKVPEGWASRLEQDQTQAECSKYRDNPPAAVADAIVAREKKNIRYPADGKLMGDWEAAIKDADNGAGKRSTDDPTKAAGGNCYACHQLDKKNVAFGTVGPSLLGYGKDRKADEQTIKETYDKIFNSQSVLACSQMPRMGANGFLTPEQVRDFVAMLLSPDSPVNK
jgi:sulfur-oxidizing protein SoxX